MLRYGDTESHSNAADTCYVVLVWNIDYSEKVI